MCIHDLLDALEQAIQLGALPLLHRLGAIGTGDLTVLAELGLTLAGERPLGNGRGAACTARHR